MLAPPGKRLFTGQAQCLFPEPFADAEILLGQLVQHRPDGFKDPLFFCPNQKCDRSEDFQTEPLADGACLAVVQNNGPASFASQGNRLGFPEVHHHVEGSDEVSFEGHLDPQPFGRGAELLVDRWRSLNRIEESGQEMEVSDAFEGDQAGAVTDDRLLQEPTSARNSSAG